MIYLDKYLLYLYLDKLYKLCEQLVILDTNNAHLDNLYFSLSYLFKWLFDRFELDKWSAKLKHLSLCSLFKCIARRQFD